MGHTKQIVESALLVALAVVLFLASNYLPVVGVVLTLLCPAPLVVLGMRQNLKYAALGTAVAALIVAATLGITASLFFSLGFGILGVGLGYLAKRFERPVDIITYGVVVSLLSKLLLIVTVTKITGINPFAMDGAEMERILQKVFSFYASAGMDSATLTAMKEQMIASIKAIPKMFPSLLIMASALDCWLSYEVTRVVLRRLGQVDLKPLPPFGNWRFPRNIFWALVVSVVLAMFGAKEGENSLTMQAGLNLRLVVQMLFFLQGASFVWYYMCEKGWKIPIRALILILLLLIPIVSQIVLLVGIVDIWWDLRTRIKGRES